MNGPETMSSFPSLLKSPNVAPSPKNCPLSQRLSHFWPKDEEVEPQSTQRAQRKGREPISPRFATSILIPLCLSLCALWSLWFNSLPLLYYANVGRLTRSPPDMADWWAQMPTRVQLALVRASGNAGCFPVTAIRKLCTRCGCEPPWPPPWRNERCVAS